MRIGILVIFALVFAAFVSGQQLPDKNFAPVVERKAYADDKGPMVCVDEAHHNFHTLGNRFWAFGKLVGLDGYRSKPNTSKFDKESLKACDILVISNAQPSDDEWSKYPYPTPSAFSKAEIDAVHEWVEKGGRLLLIADHMPLAGAAAALADAFGVKFTDGFAYEGFKTFSELEQSAAKPTIFRTADNTLRKHPITTGRDQKESVKSIRTFTGQAFQAPAQAESLLVLPGTFIALMPVVAWDFKPDTKQMPVGGWSQGAVLKAGKGRAAFFGEAAMFSAQVSGAERRPMGMNAPGAEQNAQFVLNVMHWLSGIL